MGPLASLARFLFIIIFFVQPHKNLIIFAHNRPLCTPCSQTVTSPQPYCRQKRLFLLHNARAGNMDNMLATILVKEVIALLLGALQVLNNVVPFPQELINWHGLPINIIVLSSQSLIAMERRSFTIQGKVGTDHCKNYSTHN